MHRRFLSLIALAAALPHLSGQTPQKNPPAKAKAAAIPRTPDGHPDLQGIWINAFLTPLERPDELTGKLNLTDAEAIAYEKRRLEAGDADRRNANPEADVGQAYNQAFYDRGVHLARVDGSSRTSMIIDPPYGKLPALTHESQKRIESAR